MIEEKEFNLSILANKKPYFFIYNYDKLKKEFMEYYKPNNQVCMAKYKCEIHELYKKQNKTQREKEFLLNYEFGCPVNVTPCLCNKIAWMVEDHFRDVSTLYETDTFDCELLKNPDITYSTTMYNKIKKVKEEYDNMVQKSIKQRYNDFGDSYDANDFKEKLLDEFEQKLFVICKDKQTLCNILVDVCYNTSKSKTLLWELCGDIIINNLLRHRGYKLSFPKQSEDGDFTYKGLTFKMEEVVYETNSK